MTTRYQNKSMQLEFVPITPQCRPLFSKYVVADRLYSDFNFTSFYVWNLRGEHSFCIHNDNLIIKLSDYVTQKPTFSVLGTKNIDETLIDVLAYAENHYDVSELSLIPDVAVANIKSANLFSYVEDVDNFDYVYRLNDIAEFAGRKYKSKRHAANRCEREYNLSFEKFDTISKETYESITTFLDKWKKSKQASSKDYEDSAEELQSLANVYDIFDSNSSLVLHIVYNNDTVVGFSIDELENNSYVLSHYCKTLPEVTGLFEYFNKTLAQIYLSLGYTYWNWEQDIGSEKLRRIKLSYRPAHVNKKYKIQRTTDEDTK